MNNRLNLIETIANDTKLSTFSRMLGTSGAIAVLSGSGSFTVFAPTNDAFGKISDVKMNELLNEPEQTQLKALLSYHIVPGRLMAANLPASVTRESVSGDELTFSDSSGLKVNGAGILGRNIEATDGVVHQLDTVLTPPALASSASASTSSLA